MPTDEDSEPTQAKARGRGRKKRGWTRSTTACSRRAPTTSPNSTWTSPPSQNAFEIPPAQVLKHKTRYEKKLKAGDAVEAAADLASGGTSTEEAEGNVKVTFVTDKGFHHAWRSGPREAGLAVPSRRLRVVQAIPQPRPQREVPGVCAAEELRPPGDATRDNQGSDRDQFDPREQVEERGQEQEAIDLPNISRSLERSGELSAKRKKRYVFLHG